MPHNSKRGNRHKRKNNNPFVLTIKDQKDNTDPDIWITQEDYVNAFSPLSGSEPDYEPRRWNTKDNIQSTHNCYAYVLNKIASGRDDKPQPGTRVEFQPIGDGEYNCMTFYQRMKADIPGFYLTDFKTKCNPGFYKGFIALAVNKETDAIDYHFYRQDSDMFWSHKPGRTEATKLDASGKKIINPLIANRKYDHFDYNIPCFFFCVNSKLGKIHSKRQSRRKSKLNLDFLNNLF